MIWVKSLLQTILGWMGQRDFRWFIILIHPIYFPCISSCFWSQDLMNFLHFFMKADTPYFFMSLLVRFIDHPSDQPIRLCPYHGCSSCILSNLSFSRVSFLSNKDTYARDDLAIENIRERILWLTGWFELLLFSSYTSRTKSVFFIFFFHSLNDNR